MTREEALKHLKERFNQTRFTMAIMVKPEALEHAIKALENELIGEYWNRVDATGNR